MSVSLKIAKSIDGLDEADEVSVSGVSLDFQVSTEKFNNAINEAATVLAEASRTIQMAMNVNYRALKLLQSYHGDAYRAGYYIVNKRGRNKLVPIKEVM